MGSAIFTKEEIKRLMSWGVAMIIFFVSALICTIAVFSPVQQHEVYVEKMVGEPDKVQEIINSHSAISIQGGYQLAKMWEEFPDYTKGLEAAGVISYIGACWCIYMLLKRDVTGISE